MADRRAKLCASLSLAWARLGDPRRWPHTRHFFKPFGIAHHRGEVAQRCDGHSLVTHQPGQFLRSSGLFVHTLDSKTGVERDPYDTDVSGNLIEMVNEDVKDGSLFGRAKGGVVLPPWL